MLPVSAFAAEAAADRAPSSPVSNWLVLDCGAGPWLALHIEGDAAALLEGDQATALERSATGWVGEGTTVATAAGGYSVELGERTLACEVAPGMGRWEEAASRGLRLRAVGLDPEWELELAGDSLVLRVGETRSEASLDQQGRDGEGATVVRASSVDGRELVVRVERRPCSVGPEPFDQAVAIDVGGLELRGCARSFGSR